MCIASRNWFVCLALTLSAVPAQAAAPEIGVRQIDSSPETATSRAVVVPDVPLAHTSQILPLNERGQLLGAGQSVTQVEKVLDNLALALAEAGSNFDRLVKVNVYVAQLDVIDEVHKAFARRFKAVQPAISYVVGKLTQTGALVAMDAVAVAGSDPGSAVKRISSPRLAKQLSPHIAILPAGARVYVAGQALKGKDVAEATRNTLVQLRETLKYLGLTDADVVQAKSFLVPISAAEVVRKEFAKFFGDNAVPPLVFVEWSSTLPIEIELLVWAGKARSGEPIEYLTPPGMQPSPVYSRVARINHGPTIYLSALFSTNAGDGKSEVNDIFAQMGSLLDKSGSDLKHLAKATYYCSTDDASKALTDLRPSFYDKNRPPSASKALVAGTGRAQRGLTMDIIAVPVAPKP